MVIKKLIAISVVFALVAGAAFAVDLSGQVIGAVKVVNKGGDSGNVTPPDDTELHLFTGGLNRVRIEGSGEADIGIGTIGGWVRLNAGSGGAGPNFYGLAWWQPIEALRIQIGANPDGHYDTSHIGRYGFYAQANEIGLVNSDGNWGGTSWDNAVYGGGFGSDHFALIITPIDALSVNIAIPLGGGPKAADTFKAVLFQVNYSAGFGNIHVTYQGMNTATQLGRFYVSTNLTVIDNLGIEFGLGYTIQQSNPSYKDPFSIGLAASYGAGSFGIKLRSIFGLNMESGATDKIAIRVDLLPSFAVNDNVSIFLDAGIYLPSKGNFIWHFAPYVRVGSEWGPGFYAGINVNNNGKFDMGGYKADVKLVKGMNFSIPIGLIANF